MTSVHTGVYMWKNKVNGKVYVGSASRSFKLRKGLHLSPLRRNAHINRHLQSAWNKYGEDNFDWIIVERCPPEHCIEREQYWLDHYKAANRRYGYNLSPTAGSCRGIQPTEATKAKQRQAWVRRKERGWVYSEEARQKQMLSCPSLKWVTHNGEKKTLSQWSKIYGIPKHVISGRLKHGWSTEEAFTTPAGKPGTPLNQEREDERRAKIARASKEKWADLQQRQHIMDGHRAARAKMSASQKARFARPEERAAASERTKEALARPEVRAKMSASQKGRKASPETRQKLSAVRMGHSTSDETRQKIGAAQKKSWSDPEVRQRHIDGLNNPEVKKKRGASISKAVKAAWADPVKAAQRRAKIKATVARRRKAKQTKSSVGFFHDGKW